MIYSIDLSSCQWFIQLRSSVRPVGANQFWKDNQLCTACRCLPDEIYHLGNVSLRVQMGRRHLDKAYVELGNSSSTLFHQHTFGRYSVLASRVENLHMLTAMTAVKSSVGPLQ